ncbi:aminoglycoside phosphotransferase family protein [Nodularia spumigena]|uniref:Aminoglycoside phosphotransferase family protein n=1 Tax=Nodularia spumigena UHCC 0060 TaxID=3110300 RepID=A0ABU5UUD2_NODSP|nr:aminoglycoside phosphotransferase family protein [Nodularia spumigena]MEA5526895.1 aminoglycoside phosphotransferase family protein [Nodularia spumigena UHCC 0143]MEA5609913.1 aminoglycoside phosphotransferase family protein [Nodularia spumigena UHCC 0060]MEA5613098.1 aminoglycoside phosphotransferase family protein [Nodularia spumigena UHCC 0040]
MTFILNSDNAFDYLLKQGLLDNSQQPPSKIEPVAAKNFNLLLSFTDKHKLLIKQERLNQEGKASGEFLIEWRIQEFIQRFPELDNYRQVLPEVLHFDVENSIIVFRYLDDYRDLMDFYTKEKNFSIEIATAIGTLLATIHRDTFNHQEYEDFFTKNSVNFNQISHLIRGLERIEPEIFGLVPDDGLKFFALYQRYDSLGQAIAELGQSVKPACVTHNDLKLNNILLQNNWQDSHNIIRFIDWERSAWGDPAFDLGTIIGNYVQIWLGSLVISNSLSIEESLRLAITPLELLQPSIGALTKAYLNTFPEILEHHPDYLQRVVQFAGFNLIQQIQAMLQYQRSFSNMGIAMMQVAKALLSRPVQSIPTIFGAAAEELTSFNRSAV